MARGGRAGVKFAADWWPEYGDNFGNSSETKGGKNE